MSRQSLIAEATDEIDDLPNNPGRKLSKPASIFFVAKAIDIFKKADITKPESKYIQDLNEIMTSYYSDNNKAPAIDSAYWLKIITTAAGRYVEKLNSVDDNLIDIEAKLKLEISGTRTLSAMMKKKREDLVNEIRPKGDTAETMKGKVELYTEYMKYIGGRNAIEMARRRKQSVHEVASEIDGENTNSNMTGRKRSQSTENSPRNENNSSGKKKPKNNRKADFEEGLKEKTDELARKTKEKDESMKELITVIKQAYQPENSSNLVAKIQEQQLLFWQLKVAKMQREIKLDER